MSSPTAMADQALREEYEDRGWTIRSVKAPISGEASLERAQAKCKLTSLPEMCFFESSLTLSHAASGFQLRFDPVDALCGCAHPTDLKVKAAELWTDNASVQLPGATDWTFTTDYAGTISCPQGHTEDAPDDSFNMSLLTSPVPIKFYDELVLYEDELHDNGSSVLSVKLRAMPTFFFILMRFFLRVDDVIYRVRDTRIMHVYDDPYLQIEVLEQEKSVDDVKSMVGGDMSKLYDMSVNEIIEKLDVKSRTMQRIYFSQPA